MISLQCLKLRWKDQNAKTLDGVSHQLTATEALRKDHQTLVLSFEQPLQTIIGKDLF